ncbi:sensor histidine kinase [Pseudohalioglobus lutimaris]|uniref:histidine kinase n=1 Tax=Pseudohalioglobus lutimaris TaxID=1737061 RepID=A0A2N5X533_9GAMM|nr:HAMP domain-containing sensor histidine kinase [Pseudohalioglobus lutimaris]PLW69596.1 histidine kinase [Pseudohalioglobus lutimaris]
MAIRWLKTVNFQFAALSTLVFTVFTLLLSAFIYYTVSAGMERELRDHIISETAQLLGDYYDSGSDELRHDIVERRERAPNSRLKYTLVNDQGVTVFDRIELPPIAGWSYISRTNAPELLLLTTPLEGGFRLGVAASTRGLSEFSGAIKRSTGLMITAVLFFSLAAGAILSSRFLKQVERLRNITEQVGAQSLSARIPLLGVGDDFEQLAVTINKMLERIEKLVADVQNVSVNIAHDMRTPLGRLRQQLDQLEGLELPQEANELLQRAICTLEETMGTFAALMRIAEMESGSTGIEREPVDLSTLIANLHETYSAIAEDNGQQLSCNATSGLVVQGDKALITQMLANLIENAITHNCAGVAISISAMGQAEGVEVVVADDGLGISEALRSEVLKPFFQVDRSRQSRGSGLGLSLAARIAERHGAAMELADNAPGLAVRILFKRT